MATNRRQKTDKNSDTPGIKHICKCAKKQTHSFHSNFKFWKVSGFEIKQIFKQIKSYLIVLNNIFSEK